MSEGTTGTQTNTSTGWVFWLGVSFLIILMLILGWFFGRNNQVLPVAPKAKALASCKPIPDGMAWTGKELVPLAALKSKNPNALACASAPVENNKDDWTLPIEANLAALGFDWVDLELMSSETGEDTVVVKGVTTDKSSSQAAFDIAKRAIVAADNGSHASSEVLNRIELKLGEARWADTLEAGLKGLGFDWLDFTVRGPVATLSGTAPDEASREDAYAQSQAAIARNAKASAQIRQLINGIKVDGNDDGTTDALINLAKSETDVLSIETCTEAFSKTMQGRNIQFEVGRADISPTSARLLNALSGIALLCINTNGHVVEIGGHTDTTGDPAKNFQLSEQRAESVRAYLIKLGADAKNLKAVGYGTTQLLDTSGTPEAHARNRRTEFKVTSAE